MNRVGDLVQERISVDDSVLALGCGLMGAISNTHPSYRNTRLRCRSLIGVDIYEPYLDYLKRLGIETVNHDLRVLPLPFADKSCDVVLLLGILEHLELAEASALFEDAERIAKKRVIVATPKTFHEGDLKESYPSPYAIFDVNEHQRHRCLITRSWLKIRGLQVVQPIYSLDESDKEIYWFAHKTPYQRCTLCAMDDSDPDITFDSEGVCNYCVQFRDHPEGFGIFSKSDALSHWNKLIHEIKLEGTLAGKRYDCVIGISGGVDSSFLCKVVQASGLKPIVIHIDNGFDSELSIKNMEKVIEHTGFEFHRMKPDFEAVRSLLLAYLRASVLDTDVPADYLIEAYQYRTLLRYGLRNILTGWNFHSEAFMPSAWTYRRKIDHRNLQNIHDRFGENKSLEFLPKWGALEMIWHRRTKHFRKIAPLNFIGYTKKGAIEWLKENWGWQEYRDKHGENIFSRFYQRFILYEKFGIDKRKMHYSNLVRSGGMTREDALAEIEKPPYDPEMYAKDRDFVLSKLRISSEYLDHLMNLPPVSHEEYGTDQWIYDLASKFLDVKKFGKKVLSKVGLK